MDNKPRKRQQKQDYQPVSQQESTQQQTNTAPRTSSYKPIRKGGSGKLIFILGLFVIAYFYQEPLQKLLNPEDKREEHKKMMNQFHKQEKQDPILKKRDILEKITKRTLEFTSLDLQKSLNKKNSALNFDFNDDYCIKSDALKLTFPEFVTYNKNLVFTNLESQSLINSVMHVFDDEDVLKVDTQQQSSSKGAQERKIKPTMKTNIIWQEKEQLHNYFEFGSQIGCNLSLYNHIFGIENLTDQALFSSLQHTLINNGGEQCTIQKLNNQKIFKYKNNEVYLRTFLFISSTTPLRIYSLKDIKMMVCESYEKCDQQNGRVEFKDLEQQLSIDLNIAQIQLYIFEQLSLMINLTKDKYYQDPRLFQVLTIDFGLSSEQKVFLKQIQGDLQFQNYEGEQNVEIFSEIYGILQAQLKERFVRLQYFYQKSYTEMEKNEDFVIEKEQFETINHNKAEFKQTALLELIYDGTETVPEKQFFGYLPQQCEII